MATTCANLKYDFTYKLSTGTGDTEETLVLKNVIASKSVSIWNVDKVKIPAATQVQINLQSATAPTSLAIICENTTDVLDVRVQGPTVQQWTVTQYLFANVAFTSFYLKNNSATAIYAWVCWTQKAS